MKLCCPSCDGKVDIGGGSRFRVFTCPHCRRRFRGTKADYSALDFLLQKYLLFRLRGYDHPFQTPCPHCGAPIDLEDDPQYKGVFAPSVCWACGRDLPAEPVGGFAG
jgi:hypothetical protein